MQRTTPALTAFAIAALLGGVSLAEQPQSRNAGDSTLAMAAVASGTSQDGATPPATQGPPRMATSLRELERVCGQTIEPRRAPKSTYNGRTYYFCSEEDKTKFDQSPKQFGGERARPERREEARQPRRRSC